MREDMVRQITNKYGTPIYIFDEKIIKKRVELIRESISSKVGLCFAMKANPFLLSSIDRFVDRLEVCSPGEYEICIREHIEPDKIIVSGVNKTRNSMYRIFEYSKGAGIYTIESELHYDILCECVKKYGIKIKVLLRLSSGNQFGMDKETLERILEKLMRDDLMIPVGIHYYSGTQKKLNKVEKELDMLNEYADVLKKKFALDSLVLEYGPGLMVTYFESDVNADDKGQLEALSKLLDMASCYSGITIELGRFLTSDSGSYITKVMDIKHTENTNYIIVDGGIHQLCYYGQMLGMKKPYIKILKEQTDRSPMSGIFNICGSLCTVNDVLVRDKEFFDININDILVFERCGAYSVTEGMALFLSRELPGIVLIDESGNINSLRSIEHINYLNSRREIV